MLNTNPIKDNSKLTFDEKIIVPNNPDPEEIIDPKYEPNYLDINFDEISSKTTNKKI